jgi:hypothetical protein
VLVKAVFGAVLFLDKHLPRIRVSFLSEDVHQCLWESLMLALPFIIALVDVAVLAGE